MMKQPYPFVTVRVPAIATMLVWDSVIAVLTLAPSVNMKIQEGQAVVRRSFVLSRKVEKRLKAEKPQKGVATIPAKGNVANTIKSGPANVMTRASNMATAEVMSVTSVESVRARRQVLKPAARRLL